MEFDQNLPLNLDGERFLCHAPDRFHLGLIGIEDHFVWFPRNGDTDAERISDLCSLFTHDIEPFVLRQFRFAAVRLEQDDEIRVACCAAQEEEFLFGFDILARIFESVYRFELSIVEHPHGKAEFVLRALPRKQPVTAISFWVIPDDRFSTIS